MQSPDILRHYTLKMDENKHFDRMVGQLNAEFSPFKEKEKVDPKFVTEMLDLYKKAEDLQEATNKRRVQRQDKKVHAYLKIMESGEIHPDS